MAREDECDKKIQQFLEARNKPDPFLPTEILFNIYPTPPQQDHLHIIVSYPRIMNLNCWIVESHDNRKNRNFTISVNSTQLVSDLRQLLKEKSLVPAYIAANDLSLWRVRPKINNVNLFFTHYVGFDPFSLQ